MNLVQRTIPATDGFPLAATIYGMGNDVVVVNAATAVPRQFYEAFAQFVAAHGYTVVTYDYRGIGESRPESLRGFAASFSDCLLYTSPSPRDKRQSRMPSSA